jgi:hypothetical protein
MPLSVRGVPVGVRAAGCVSVRRPHDDGGKWPHLDRLEDQVTEVSGPTRDTPGVV